MVRAPQSPGHSLSLTPRAPRATTFPRAPGAVPRLARPPLTFPPTQLPLGLLNAAQGHPILVELKSGENLNGHLVMCDTWMNLTLKEVVQSSPVRSLVLLLPVYAARRVFWLCDARNCELTEGRIGGRQVREVTGSLRQGQQRTYRARRCPTPWSRSPAPAAGGYDTARYDGRWLTSRQIKYLRVPDEIIDIAKESQQAQGGFRGGRGGQHRGGDRGRGRGRGQGRGRGRGA